MAILLCGDCLGHIMNKICMAHCDTSCFNKTWNQKYYSNILPILTKEATTGLHGQIIKKVRASKISVNDFSVFNFKFLLLNVIFTFFSNFF